MFSATGRKLIMFTILLTMLTMVCCECPAKCHCSRFSTFCSLAGLNTLPTKLLNSTQFLKIELDNITQINTTTNLQNLTHLKLVRAQLKELHPGAFQNMSKLEYLEITYNNISALKRNSFKYLDNLYFLNLSRNEINHLERGTFSGLTRIKILDLSNNHIKRLKANSFEGMRYNIISTVEYEHLIRSSFIEPTAFKYLSTLTYFTALCDDQFSSLYYYDLPYKYFAVRIYYSQIEYINRNNRPISELSYLHISGDFLLDLKDLKFENLNQLTHLDLPLNGIMEINGGDFEGLVRLKRLVIKDNFMVRLNKGTFHGLYSLETLDISHCKVTTIERNAFEGLSELRILDLSLNNLHSLEENTFSPLTTLKEIKLEGNAIKNIDIRAFSVMKYLKTISNARDTFKFHRKFSFIQSFKNFFGYSAHKCPHLNALKLSELLNLQRLDNLDLFAHIKISQDIQVLKTLHLYIDAGFVHPQKELRDTLQTVRFMRDISVALLYLNSTNIFPTFSEFHISNLLILCSDLKLINNGSLNGLSRLEYFTLLGISNTTIEEGAFRYMSNLRELKLHYKFNLIYRQGSFLGLQNLRLLSIEDISRNKYRPFSGRAKNSLKRDETTGCLGRSVFLGLNNLVILHLPNNGIRCLKPGAFQGLDIIEEINLSNNDIKRIEPGVFGALCKDEFQISCKNVTLSEYCNNSNALITLKYLRLDFNNISQIHPYAFSSCTNLETLYLSFNKLLNLDNSFLYTPGLKTLYMPGCAIFNIPNNTFECTPLLSYINFNQNEKINTFTLSTLLPLRHLQNIHLTNSPIRCDCNFFEIWIWMRQHRVRYSIKCNKSEIIDHYISNKYAETELSNMNCINMTNIMNVLQNRTTNVNDFAFFKHYIEPIVLIIILIFGLAFNGFLLFVALRNSDTRTKQNACIIHLATIDMLTLLLNLPLSYWDVVNIRWEFDDSLCKIFIFSKDVMVGVNAFSIVALSVERYLVARNFNNFKKICKSESQPTVWLLLMTWISGIVTSLPAYYSATVEQRCLYCPPGNQDYIRNVWTFQLIMYCLLPTFAIIFLNIKTSFFLSESIRNIPGEIKDNINARNRKRVANIVLILVLVFIISYLPNYILRVLVAWSVVDMEDLFLPSFFTFCLFFCNTVFNPISIFIMSSKFKSYALSYFPFLENIK